MDHERGVDARRRWWRIVGAGNNPAAAVYGVVIASAVLAVDAGLNVPTVGTVESVLGALVIYWLAEAYAHLVTDPPASGGTRAWLVDARRTLAKQSPLVLAPLWLLAVMLLARLAGASPSAADTWALVAGIVLLGTAGAGSAVRAGRSGATAAVTGLLGALFGVAAILLKTMIHAVH